MTHLPENGNKSKNKVWFLNWQSSGKLDQGNKRSGKSKQYLSNHILSLQDKVLTICKKNNFFFFEGKKHGMERDYFDNEYLENFPLIYVGVAYNYVTYKNIHIPML